MQIVRPLESIAETPSDIRGYSTVVCNVLTLSDRMKVRGAVPGWGETEE